MIKLIKPNNKRTACLFGQIRVHTPSGLPKHREKLGSDPQLGIKVKPVSSNEYRMISFKRKSSFMLV